MLRGVDMQHAGTNLYTLSWWLGCFSPILGAVGLTASV